MNNVDKQYLDLLNDILENGTLKKTRSGNVYSVFGRTMRFNLKEGLPLLTTKKVFTKGIIHELLWFLNGETNIKYLVDNNVNIWTDDAYRHYIDLLSKHNSICWSKNNTDELIGILYKEDFVENVKKETTKKLYIDFDLNTKYYKYGDLGPVYGKQWKEYGDKKINQINNIVEMLKINPDDRRMLCVAWNPTDFEEMALPPCHYGFQVYTRELNNIERFNWLCENSNGEYDEWKTITEERLDSLNVPKRELSLSFSMRSNDFCCGNPYNIAQYGMLAYMLCEVCNMVPGELIYNGGDVHVYENHVESAKEQLSRNGSNKVPKLKFGRKINNIDDFKYEDFIIENYEPNASIKYELNVGL